MLNNLNNMFPYFMIKYRNFEAFMIYYFKEIFKLESRAITINTHDIKKSSDIAFIMGSGFSINEIKKEEWKNIKKSGDIFAFNYFFRGNFVPIDFHVIREVEHSNTVIKSKSVKYYFNEILNNSCYKNTIFFIIDDIKSSPVNWSIFYKKLFKNRKICFYKNLANRNLIRAPSRDINNIPHCGATLFDTINLCYILGYKEVVLVGVDLYDRRYFWLKENESREIDLKRGSTYKDTHNTKNLVIETIRIWNKYLKENNLQLYVYNPKSLLKEVIPIYMSKY